MIPRTNVEEIADLVARLVLNFKGLEYETRWVEYPDIKSTISPQYVLLGSFELG